MFTVSMQMHGLPNPVKLQAVQYLYSFQPVDAVHFAIALTYYGLMGVTSSSTQRADSNLREFHIPENAA